MNTKNVTLSVNDKIALISNLATMLSAGIAISEAVGSLVEDSRGSQKIVLSTLHQDILQGHQVHTSFAKFPRIFDQVMVSLIKASEQSGTLEATLRDIQINVMRDVEFVDKVKFAMIYPVVVMVVFAGVLMLMLVVVIPKIASVFGRLNVELPLPTKILIGLSDLVLKQTWLIVGGGAIGLGVGAYLYWAHRDKFLAIVTSVPIVSGLVKQIDLTRFSRSMHMLLSSGLPITQALDLARDVVIKKRMVEMIKKSAEMVMQGRKLSEGLAQARGQVPSIVVKLIEVGERTGSLEKSMADVANYFDYQVTNSLKTLTALLEPIMLVVVGVAVGGMMLAIIAPIYGLVGQIGGR